MECELAMDSCIQGHHVFKNIWTPTMGEQLSCKREIGKNKDRYAVAAFRTAPRLDVCLGRYLLLAPYFSTEKAVFIV